jgi:hypothetical protein
MVRRKPAPDLIRGGHRFAVKNIRRAVIRRSGVRYRAIFIAVRPLVVYSHRRKIAPQPSRVATVRQTKTSLRSPTDVAAASSAKEAAPGRKTWAWSIFSAENTIE